MNLRTIAVLLLLLVTATVTGCASTREVPDSGVVKLHPGHTFTFEDQTYRIDKVAGDYVVMRHADGAGDKGEITGWVEEVFRVNREYLSEGVWRMHPKLSGLYLRWLGGDVFSISRDPSVLRANEPLLIN
jgi:hypothetical protein